MTEVSNTPTMPIEGSSSPFLAATTSSRWRWIPLLDLLDQLEIAALHRVCCAWRRAQQQEIRQRFSGDTDNDSNKNIGVILNLTLNSHGRCSAIVAAAASSNSASTFQRLILEFCNKLQDADLRCLSKMPNLTHLNLNAARSLTDASMSHVAAHCHKLTRLDLFWDVAFTDKAIHSIHSASFPPLLTHLNLSGLKHITDSPLAPLIRRCPQLTFLDLTRCESIGSESLKAIGESCHHLRTLLLYAAPQHTDEGFLAMAPGTPHLTHLDLTGIKGITDATMESLAQHCKKLEILQLMWATPLTDRTLEALGKAPMTNLTDLSIHGNVHMTESGMESLSKGCGNLLKLDVNGCKNLGRYRMNLETLREIFPKLKQLVYL